MHIVPLLAYYLVLFCRCLSQHPLVFFGSQEYDNGCSLADFWVYPDEDEEDSI